MLKLIINGTKASKNTCLVSGRINRKIFKQIYNLRKTSVLLEYKFRFSAQKTGYSQKKTPYRGCCPNTITSEGSARKLLTGDVAPTLFYLEQVHVSIHLIAL